MGRLQSYGAGGAWQEAAGLATSSQHQRLTGCLPARQGFDKGIKQHFDRCTGAPKRRRRSPDADLQGDVIGDEDEEDEDDEDEGGQDGRSVRKLVGGVQGFIATGSVSQVTASCNAVRLPPRSQDPLGQLLELS